MQELELRTLRKTLSRKCESLDLFDLEAEVDLKLNYFENLRIIVGKLQTLGLMKKEYSESDFESQLESSDENTLKEAFRSLDGKALKPVIEEVKSRKLERIQELREALHKAEAEEENE